MSPIFEHVAEDQRCLLYNGGGGGGGISSLVRGYPDGYLELGIMMTVFKHIGYVQCSYSRTENQKDLQISLQALDLCSADST